MALNPTHIFEDLGDTKCAIVEKNCSKERVQFLKELLEFNGYTVISIPSPPAKGVKPAAEGEAIPATIETFTVGVTDVTFSPINAVFNRELKTKSGEVVTKNYWQQKESICKSAEWYWKN